MYTGKFTFYILSENRKTEEILSEISPLEDCEYSFRTVSTLDCPLEVDCAVIADGIEAVISAEKKYKPARLAALVPASALTEFDGGILNSADDLWIMPDGDIYNKALLMSYFGRLARAMKESFDYRRLRI